VYNAVLHVTDPDIPANAGRYRPIEVIAPLGSVVNAAYPAATVGGNSEVHPHLVTLIWKALASAVPERVSAGCSETSMLVTIGGEDPRTGEFYCNLMLEGQGWGGTLHADGHDVVTPPNSNCVVTPVEILETRFPLRHHEYRLNVNSGGAGRTRGGLGTIRTLELMAPMTVSCYHSSERLIPWGLFDGREGSVSSFTVKLPDDPGFENFRERFGVRCASKFTNVRLPVGTLLRMTVGGAGGFGPPQEREVARIAQDLYDGLYDEQHVRDSYPEQARAALELRDELRAGRVQQARIPSAKPIPGGVGRRSEPSPPSPERHSNG
jgi:N-methylhydantoinase B